MHQMIRFALACLLVVAPCLTAPAGQRPDEEGSFSVELVAFPESIAVAETLEGRVKVTNLAPRRREFSIQTYVPTQYGLATLPTRATLSLPGDDAGNQPWIVPTARLEPGDYEIQIGVRRGRELVLVPLRFRVG